MNHYHFKSSILLLLLMFFSAIVSAQSNRQFSVASFALDQFDMTARNEQYKKIDGNGSLYAIIKITSSNPDDKLSEYRFSFGNMNHEVVIRDGELWVYVQRNAKFVTISRQGFATINKYDLGLTIEEGRTYTMKLSPEGKNILLQYVKFEVTPTDANAVIMGKEDKPHAIETVFGTTDYEGKVAKNLPYGTYSYQVKSENYHPTEGRFTLNDQSKVFIEKVILRPLFSEITLKTSNGANIYVNGESKGKGMWSGRLNAGSYQVECRQDNHKSSYKTITVEEGKPQTITLDAPVPITGTLSVSSSPLDADVVIDGRKTDKKTPFTIPELLIGSHTLLLSKSGYEDKTIYVSIRENERTEEDVQLTPKKVETPVVTQLTPVTPSRSTYSSTSYTKPQEQTSYKKPRKRIHLGYEYDKGWHFGLSAGLNTSTLLDMGDKYTDYKDPHERTFGRKTGKSFGGVLEYMFDGENVFPYLRSGFNYTERGFYEDEPVNGEAALMDSNMKYYEVPLAFGVHIPFPSYDPTGSVIFELGPYFAFADKDTGYIKTNSDGTTENVESSFDWGLSFGLGIQWMGFRFRISYDLGLYPRVENEYKELIKTGDYTTSSWSFTLSYMFK